VIKEIINEIKTLGALSSATLGDLPYKPGTASLAALGATVCGVDYIKAGLYGARNYSEAHDMMSSIVQAVRMVNSSTLVVAAGYADFARFGGVNYKDLVNAAKDSEADVVMVDTAIKDGKNLFDALNTAQIREFVDLAHEAGLIVALAGSLKKEHLAELTALNPDIIGIRGDVCDKGLRTSGLVKEKVEAFMEQALARNHK
jgi:hypothetical protein